jgi:Domain of unknown function (DUF4386)
LAGAKTFRQSAGELAFPLVTPSTRRGEGMTRTTNARLAGFTSLFYMAVGTSNEVLMGRAKGAEGVAAKLARIGEHATEVRVATVLAVLECLSAVVVGVALYGVTRDEDHELALLALVCRAAEGIINSINIPGNLELLWLAQPQGGAGALDAATRHALGTFLLIPGGPIAAIFFAVGSTLFSYLLLRGRMVPAWLAGWGVLASVLLVVGLPLQVAGFFTGQLTGYQWVPAIGFTLVLGLWLVIKGVAAPPRDERLDST